MNAQFWINAWDQGKTNFHEDEYHDKLIQYFPLFQPTSGQNVLVPLCGKTKDLIWLCKQELNVHGIEVYEQPVEAFFQENKLAPVKKTQTPNFLDYEFENLKISCGDFFILTADQVYDYVYDRASLVALPQDMRKQYAQIITKCIRPGGKYLLIVYRYDQTKLDGPPFSVTPEEVHELYEKNFTIQKMESGRPVKEGPRLAALDHFEQTVYTLERR